MNIKSIATVDFLVGTSGSGICEMGAVISREPSFPSHHGVIFQGLAQGLLPPVRAQCHLPSLSSHSPGLKVHITQS